MTEYFRQQASGASLFKISEERTSHLSDIMGRLGDVPSEALKLLRGNAIKHLGASIKAEMALLDRQGWWRTPRTGSSCSWGNIGIKTAELEDKATACQMSVCYA